MLSTKKIHFAVHMYKIFRIIETTMKLTILITLIAIANAKKAKKDDGFFIGKVPPGRFEYSELNGFYYPQEAKEICQSDLQCAGFTFKTAKNAEAETFIRY